MKLRLESFAFFLLMVFAFAGLIIIVVTVHELSHFQDIRSIAEDPSEICLLVIPTSKEALTSGPLGYYEYHYNFTNVSVRDKESDVSQITETKAYATSIIIFIFFLALMIIVLRKRMELQLKAQIFDEATNEKINP